jgi:hypothetical protein
LDETTRHFPGGSVQTGTPAEVSPTDEFGWQGWLVVAAVFIAVVCIPLFVLFLPEAHWVISRLGFSRRQAYIVFPMLPAILLGILAVWGSLRSYGRDT